MDCNICADSCVLSKISPSLEVFQGAMISTAVATHISRTNGSPGILGITYVPMDCCVVAKGMVGDFAIEGMKSCSRARRKGEANFDQRPDGKVGSCVEEVRARFEAMDVWNADDGCGGSAIYD